MPPSGMCQGDEQSSDVPETADVSMHENPTLLETEHDKDDHKNATPEHDNDDDDDEHVCLSDTNFFNTSTSSSSSSSAKSTEFDMYHLAQMFIEHKHLPVDHPSRYSPNIPSVIDRNFLIGTSLDDLKAVVSQTIKHGPLALRLWSVLLRRCDEATPKTIRSLFKDRAFPASLLFGPSGHPTKDLTTLYTFMYFGLNPNSLPRHMIQKITTEKQWEDVCKALHVGGLMATTQKSMEWVMSKDIDKIMMAMSDFIDWDLVKSLKTTHPEPKFHDPCVFRYMKLE